MIAYHCSQGSLEWSRLRAGRPTASDFDRIITPGGKSSKSASDYCNKLLAEVMLGRPLGSITMPWMERGKNLEAEAVTYYEFMRGVETMPIGFITTDDGRIGASPDRLVGETGLLETKCPSDEVHTRYMAAHIDALLGSDQSVADDYKVQVQGQLFVSEREWVDILAYFPGLPEAVTRVNRDEPFIALMKAELYRFIETFDARMDKLRSLGYLTEAPKSAAEEETRAFGLSQDEIEGYIADLKKEGVLSDGRATA